MWDFPQQRAVEGEAWGGGLELAVAAADGGGVGFEDRVEGA